MGRRLSALIFAALLAFTAAGCGDDSDDEPTTEDTTQTDTASDDDTTEPSESTDTPDGADDTDDKGETDDGDDDKGDGDDDNGAIPDDVESDEPDDPDDLPIDAEVVLDTCEQVDPKDTWPGVDEISFDGGASNVVATADVQMKGGQTVTVVCDVAGSKQNPKVKAYSPIS